MGISFWEMTALVVISSLCGNVFLASHVAVVAGGHAWWVPFGGGLLLALILISMLVGVGIRHPRVQALEWPKAFLGRTIGWIVLLTWTIEIWLSMAYDLWLVTNVITSTQLFMTPHQVITGALVLVTLIASGTGIANLARVAPLAMVGNVFTLLVAVVSGRYFFDYGYLRPLTQFQDIRWTTLEFWVAFLLIVRFVPTTAILVGFLRNRTEAALSPVVGFLLGASLLTFTIATPIAGLGLGGALVMNRPFNYLADSTEISSFPLRRTGLLVQVFFTTNILFTLAARQVLLGMSLKVLAPRFKENTARVVATLVAAAVAIHLAVLEVGPDLWGYWTIVGTVVFIPVVLVIWALSRWRRPDADPPPPSGAYRVQPAVDGSLAERTET